MSAEWGIVSAECWISFMMNEEDNANDGKSQQGWSPSMSSVHSWQDHAGQSDSALKLLPPGHVKAAVKLALTGGNWSIGGMGRTTVGRVLHVFLQIYVQKYIFVYTWCKSKPLAILCSHIFFNLVSMMCMIVVSHEIFPESQALTIDHGPCRRCALRRHGVKDTVWAGMTRYPIP